MSWRGWSIAGAIAVGVVLVVVILTSSSSPTHPATPRAAAAQPATPLAPAVLAPTGEMLGASVNHLFNDLTYSHPQINAQLSALHATGATLARSDALWGASEPFAPHQGHHLYNWSFDDGVAGALAAHHLSWLPILDYSTSWSESASGQDRSPPRSDADYADYARAFAGRYGAGGSFWRSHPELPAYPVAAIEIWNEPDNGEFWVPGPDPTAYADLYMAARRAIDSVDPSARVIVGGLVNPTEFLPAMLQARPQLRGHLDGVGIHPYGPPHRVLARIRAARSTLSSLGMPGTPLYVTEFGWTTAPPTAPDYVGPGLRPGYILKTLTDFGHMDCGVAAAVLYAWVTPQHNPTDGGDWYGVNGPRGASTPDSAAFTAGLKAARAPGPAVSVCGGI